MRGPANPAYTGGRFVGANGYVYVLVAEHPRRDVRGYVLEHRLVMESVIGRYLTADEVVHHINHERTDNRAENLHLYATQSEHRAAHARESA